MNAAVVAMQAGMKVLFLLANFLNRFFFICGVEIIGNKVNLFEKRSLDPQSLEQSEDQFPLKQNQKKETNKQKPNKM